MEQLRQAVALLFRRKGKPSMTEKEFVLSASMDLRWFPPRDAQRLLQAGVAARFLRVEQGQVSPTFDVGSVEVPLDFHPTGEIFKPPSTDDVFLTIVERLARATKQDTKSIVVRVNDIQGRLGIQAEAAALVVARSFGVDVADLYGSVEELIFKRVSRAL